jgi:glycine hydroxymethyltransferase
MSRFEASQDRKALAAPLAELDPEVAGLIAGELERQRATLDLVASESVPPRAVLEAQGSILTAKYADGYPQHRDYDTCEWIDSIETLAIERAKALFGAGHANVQPYSGSNANLDVLYALCEPGDPVLGWDFDHGGHPTHYWSGSFAGKYLRGFSYGVRREDRLLDMEEVAAVARRVRPRVIFAGWSCYSRALDFASFRHIADEMGAYLVADMAHYAGLVAAGLYPDPVPHADVCTMTAHKTLGGARGGVILCRSELARKIDEAVYPGAQGGPLPHVFAAMAVTLALAGTEAFRERMGRTVEGARAMAAVIEGGKEETGLSVLTGGTDVHQFTVDVSATGEDAFAAMDRLNALGISGNAMRIAFDPLEEPGASGLRFGANALAGRGFGPGEFEETGRILLEALGDRAAERSKELAGRVQELLAAFPLYPYLSGKPASGAAC